MFKILVLQRMYNLSDEQTEYQIVDRTSFRTFLGLASGDNVPDARTIWTFKEQLTEKNLYDKLFADFDKFLREKNLIMYLQLSVVCRGYECQQNADLEAE